ncbi:MAG: glucose 1-dehydrogenase [Sphingomonas sp.]|nr:glucose 1-dehydrogenase [Sphingomonas sp.]
MLENKIIIITGAGSGIGRAAAVLFAEAGARLVIADVNEQAVNDTRTMIVANGSEAIAIRIDVSSEDDAKQLAQTAIDTYGRLDGAFNNAGVQMRNRLLQDLSLEEWNLVNSINATGVFLCMKYQIPAMRLGGGGAIVNTASGNGVVAQPYSTEYVASKHAVVGITRAASTEAAETGVRVNAVLPGMIETPMVADLINSPDFKPHYDSALARHTIGRFGTADDVAYVARFLLSDQSAFVNGAAIAVDGGYTAR